MVNYKLKERIPDLLKDYGPLTKDEIKKKILENYDEIQRISDKSLNENLISLYENDLISIIGYKIKKVPREQSFNPDRLIFYVTLTSPIEIRALLEQLKNNYPEKIEKNDHEKIKEHLKKLYIQFEEKYKEYEQKKLEFYKELENKIECIPIYDAIIVIEDQLNNLKNSGIEYVVPDYNGFKSVDLSENLKIYKKCYNNHKNAKIWKFEEFSLEDFKKIILDSERPKFGFSPFVYGKELSGVYNDWECVEIEKYANSGFIEVDRIWYPKTNENIVASKESFLLKFGIKKPIKLEKNEIWEIHNKILINLVLYNSEDKIDYSIALSDAENSMDNFEEIIIKYTALK